jgi:hypothetical protein
MGKAFRRKASFHQSRQGNRAAMAKLGFVLFFLLCGSVRAGSLKLEYFGETSLPQKIKLDGNEVGGLSGITWNDGKLFAVSDDRGKFGAPRFYELDLKISSGKVELSLGKVYRFKGISKKWILDLEGMAPLPNGDFVFSSEGDNNAKPREWPRIFITSPQGDYKTELTLPDKFLPDLLGEQKKGIENNRGFEGLTISPDAQNIYIMNEVPILGDQTTKEDSSQWVRLVQFTKDKTGYKAVAEFPYLLEAHADSPRGPELMRGISEILFWKENKFITLERGARLSTRGIGYTGALYLADFQGTKDVSKVANLTEAKISSARKEKLADLESILAKNVKDKIDNFEGLTWGPNLPDGRKSLLVISDNNFAAKEKTQLLVFAVKEVE